MNSNSTPQRQQETGLAKYTPKQAFSHDSIKRRFEKVLGDKATGFVTSVLQVINDSKMLQKADTNSIFNAAMTAATLDLPINPNLGFAYIIPYNNKGGTVAQFQMGYKGFIQLAQRSGQYKTISATPIYAGQLIKENPLTGFEFNFDVAGEGDAIGYASYFELLNGFQKTLYMTLEDVQTHAKTYSQSYKKGFGPWVENFEVMALKTVIKLLISKYGPLSVDMEKAVTFDQGEVKDPNGMNVGYIDNQPTGPEHRDMDIHADEIEQYSDDEELPFK